MKTPEGKCRLHREDYRPVIVPLRAEAAAGARGSMEFHAGARSRRSLPE
jgi:hypothetical protein